MLKKIDELKTRIDRSRPADPHLAGQIKEFYRIRLTSSSNALEGNSYTETETKIVLEDGIAIGGKPIRDLLEALGHSEAYDLMWRLSGGKRITEINIKALHKLFYYRIDRNHAGRYRDRKVLITGTDFIPPLPALVPSLMADFVDSIPKLRSNYHPVEFAAELHRQFVMIHPFVDGNGRVGRLLMNLALLQEGYPIAIIPPDLRSEYIDSLNNVHKGDKRQFQSFIERVCYKSAKDYLRYL